jgi:shikimate kinase
LTLCGVVISQKLGVDEEIYVVNLKKGKVTKGLSL